MAPKPNKAFVRIGCGLTPLSSPNCAYYEQGEKFSTPVDTHGERDRYFCKHFDKRNLGCVSVWAAGNAMIRELQSLGIHIKADDSKFKEEPSDGQ